MHAPMCVSAVRVYTYESVHMSARYIPKCAHAKENELTAAASHELGFSLHISVESAFRILSFPPIPPHFGFLFTPAFLLRYVIALCIHSYIALRATIQPNL